MYIFIFSWFPSSDLPVIGKACMKIRDICVRGFVSQVGKNVNIQRRVTISSKLIIGERFGIGKFSRVAGPTTILVFDLGKNYYI